MIKFDSIIVRGILACSLGIAVPAFAQLKTAADGDESSEPDGAKTERRIIAESDGQFPMFVEEGPTLTSTLYSDGSRIEVPTQIVSRFSCFTDTSDLTLTDLKAAVKQSEQSNGLWNPIVVNDRGAERGTGLNIVLNVIEGSPPANALTAMEESAQYVESQFNDSLTVTINFRWISFGGLAFTQNVSVSTSYTNARNGLIGDMDSDDSIQSFLPLGGTLPVRFNGASATVTNENTIHFSKDNFRAAIGSLGGANSTIAMNSAINYDFDPSNGIVFSQFSFQDTLIHEIGHALGFTSAVDTNAALGFTQTESLDMFRFQRTDGTGDFNPDTLAEFQTTARTIDQNVPNDDANSDLIDFEYRMSDGNPDQASHFREQNPTIGVMDPIIANGETTFPDQYLESDINMLDAIGWDFVSGDCNNNGTLDECEIDCDVPGCFFEPGCGTAVDCNADGVPDDCQLIGNDCNANTVPDDCEIDALITGHPSPLGVCPGDPASFSITASGAGTFQWKLDGGDVSNGGGISGATTDMLSISSVDESDEGDYTCDAADGCVVATSNPAALTVFDPVSITAQPLASNSLCAGATGLITVTAAGDNLTYEWRKNGVALVNGGKISGADTSDLFISDLSLSDEASAPGYTCFISDGCGNSEESNASELEIVGADYVSQPQDVCVDTGQPAVFSVVVNPPDGTFLILGWYKDGSPLSNGGNISGATTDTLTINPTSAADIGTYSLRSVVFGPNCIEFSDEVQLNLAPCGCISPGDFENDGDYDLTDMQAFMQCFGEDVSVNMSCDCANVDAGNNVVDIDDWTGLEALLSGP